VISTGNYFPLLDGGVERSWLPRVFTLSENPVFYWLALSSLQLIRVFI